MADINTVMSWLEGLTWDDWHEYHSDSEVQNIAKSALELLNWQKFSQYRSNDLFFMPIEKVFDGWHNERYLLQCLYNLQEKHDCGAIPDEEWKILTNKYPE